jgi:hypothetical protein
MSDQSAFFARYLPRFNSPFSIALSSSASTNTAKSSIFHTRLATAHYLCRVMAAMLPIFVTPGADALMDSKAR